MASGDHLIIAEKYIIIIAFFFLLHYSEYMASKSESTPFRLKDTKCSCVHSIFADTATESDIQAANFVTLTFTTHKNGNMERGIGHNNCANK